MPAYVTRAERSQRKRSTAAPRTRRTKPKPDDHQSDDDLSTDSTSATPVEAESRVVGRLRVYVTPENGREFDPTNPQTPEGRLVDANSVSWSIPEGREPHLRKKSGHRAKDINPEDVGKYKKSDFTTKASNEHDHSRALKIHMPTQMVNELTAVVDSKVFPVRNIEALARTLIYEGLEVLHMIARQDGLFIPHSHHAQLEALATLNRNYLAVLVYDDMLEQNCDVIRSLLRRGARNKARAMVFEMIEIAKKLNSTEMREKWREEIDTHFKFLLKGKPARVYIPDHEGDDS